ncbi:DUF87 domain-containing protein [Candidatus Parcubacteria bacterium]|nr:MAG: DUF87 domain-containing protein [Candidatus Parcubacteria bacterium]
MDGRASDKDITFFGETNFRGQRRRFGIQRGDRRKHVYIIGKTGMGKSTLLENMTIQDIQAGHGVAVVDPHGEYAERVLQFVPEHRIKDVVYFNPVDIEYPMAFNVMEAVAEDQRHLITSGLLSVFKKIFGPEVWSARMEYLLANAILALLQVKGSTLLSVNRMFGEKEFRRQIVAQLTDPVIRGFWENEFAKYPEQYMREAVAAIQNKIGQFSGNPLIRNVIGQVETSLDMRAIMDEQKIFIVNLSKGNIGEENSRLLGAMMVAKLYLTAMSRVDIPEPERKDFYLYVDEFQNFATESFANILSEARKYRLNLTVAHQYIAQMEEEVQHAIFGNVGTMITFRIGAEDAELLEKEFMPEFMVQDLVNLGFKQVYLKLMIDGLTSRPFSAETLPPMPTPAQSFVKEIVQYSREHYSAPRAQVEEKIREFTLGGFEAVPGAGLRSAGAAAAKPDRPMYEAKCAVDQKSILVPFKPDGKRPVFCEEHMHLIQFRSQMADGATAPTDAAAPTGAAPTSSASASAAKQGERPQGGRDRNARRDAKPLSLKELRPAAPARESERRSDQSKQADASRSAHHLGELRKALAEAMNGDQPREKKIPAAASVPAAQMPPRSNEKDIAAPPPAIESRPRKKEPAAPRGSAMAPGEVIRLD